MLELNKEELERAKEVVSIYLAHNQDIDLPHGILGPVLFGNGWFVQERYNSAVKSYNQTIRGNKGKHNFARITAVALNNRGVCFEREGKLEESLNSYLESVETDQTFVLGMYHAVRILKKVDQSKAEYFIKKILSVSQAGNVGRSYGIELSVINEDFLFACKPEQLSLGFN